MALKEGREGDCTEARPEEREGWTDIGMEEAGGLDVFFL